MCSAFNQAQSLSFQTADPTVNRQFARAAAMDIDEPAILPVSQSQPIVIPRQTPLTYAPYSLGYVLSTRRVFMPSVITSPQPATGQCRITSPHTYSYISVTDLPEILFRLEPYKDDFVNPQTGEDYPVPAMHDSETQRPILTNRGDPLRFFSFLPRFVANDVPGYLLEYWFRLDYRLEMNDVRMRIEKDANGVLPNGNALNMRRNRFRTNIKADAWTSSRSWPTKTEIEVLDKITALQICLNATMEVDLANGRLLKPTFAAGNTGCSAPQGNNVQNYIDAGVPLNYFLLNPSDTIPSGKMLARIILRKRLQNLTMILRPGPESLSRTAYRMLPVGDDPSWWHDTGPGNEHAIHPHGRQIYEIDNLTHRGFMEEQFGDPSEFVGVVSRNKLRRIKPWYVAGKVMEGKLT